MIVFGIVGIVSVDGTNIKLAAVTAAASIFCADVLVAQLDKRWSGFSGAKCVASVGVGGIPIDCPLFSLIC